MSIWGASVAELAESMRAFAPIGVTAEQLARTLEHKPMGAPTIHDAARLVAQHYGMTMQEVMVLFRTPLHPAGLRDQFAGQALQGMGLKVIHTDAWAHLHPAAARQAYSLADAMLAARVAGRDAT